MGRKKIAILMASIDREYQDDFVKEAFSAAAEKGLDVCVFNCQGYTDVDMSPTEVGESMIFDLPLLREFDGFISLRATLAEGAPQKKVETVLREMSGKPHVSMDVRDDSAVTILFDDAISMRQVTEHVIAQHGARRIAYLSGPLNQEVSRIRLRACRETMAEHGLELMPEDCFEGEWVHQSGVRCAEKLMERGEPLPDAILCGNDDMAFGAVEYLTEHGVFIPDNVIVAGFDALREAVARGLTTVRRPIDQAARKAIEVLDAWIGGEKPEKRTIILPTIPVYGGSCGCETARKEAPVPGRMMRNGRRRAENVLLQISAFNGTLASAADAEDAHRKIDQFVNALGIREMYVCVDPELTGEQAEPETGFAYPREMQLLYGRKGERLFPLSRMETGRLVPTLDEEREESIRLIFFPLYFRMRNFGYLAMERGVATGLALYSVLMLFNGALMSLYLQTNLRNYARKVKEMAVTDIMTGMLNRRGFMEQSPRTMEQAAREGRYFVLFSADMDSMKKINDAFGHLAGDQAIIRIGKALSTLERFGMTMVHISGDEFLAYGTAKDGEAVSRMLEAVREAVREQNVTDPWVMETGASIGVYAAIPRDGDSLDLFLNRADHAMYEEKARRKKGN